MTSVKYCPKCGNALEEGERFCGHCGFDLKQIPETITSEEPSRNDFDLAQKEFNSANKVAPQNQSVPTNNKIMIIIIASVLALLVLIGGGVLLWVNRGAKEEPKKVANITLEAPTYSLNEGTYTGQQTVTINKPEGDQVEIYYTTDGSDPSIQSSKYEQPIVLATTATIKSLAIDKKGNASPIKTASYVIDLPKEAKTQPPAKPADPAAAQNAERAAFDSNIQGTWMMVEDSGYVLYFSFIDGYFEVGDGGDYYGNNYTFTVDPGSNGTTGTVYVVDKYVISIDCNPMGDNAIYIDGNYSTYY